MVVVDDHSLFAEALVVALGGVGYDARSLVPGPNLTSSACLADEVMAAEPFVALVDLHLGSHLDGVELVERLSARSVAVMVLTGTSDPVLMGRALAAGAATVMSKGSPMSAVMAALVRIHNGLPVMSQHEREWLLSRWRGEMEFDQEVRARFDLLTTREAEVLGQLMLGRQVGEIARRSFVSESTVRTQVKSVLAKLEVNSQLTAVGLAYRVGWGSATTSAFDDWSDTVPGLRSSRVTASRGA